MKIYFSDYFNVDPVDLDAYGAFNVSLINDLPVFIDPFLLFNSEKDEYQALHAEIIRYVRFLRDVSKEQGIAEGLLQQWYRFPEVKQTWLGYSKVGNKGSGLGPRFANALHQNLHTIFSDFGQEQITQGSHLEKLCLVREGVGKDNISDFTTNLIKGFLCRYSEQFAAEKIDASQIRNVPVTHVAFNYETRSWTTRYFRLPFIDGDFVLLTPKDLLTKDEAWINKRDMIGEFDDIAESVPNSQLRSQISQYFLRQLPAEPAKEDVTAAIVATLRKYPVLIDYYIKLKEEHGEQAVAISEERVRETEEVFIKQVLDLVLTLQQGTQFYTSSGDTYREAHARVAFLKQAIEDNDGYRVFYVKGQPIKRESDLQLMFRLTWYAAEESVDSEVNNGRGPVDFKISRGSKDSTLVEFKLASNAKLKQNLQKQVDIYKKANRTDRAIKVIMCFSEAEMEKTIRILNDLELSGNPDIVLIDADRTNKPSASTAR